MTQTDSTKASAQSAAQPAENPAREGAANSGEQQVLESGTYEILKTRLEQQSDTLKGRLRKLNDARKEVFGSVESTLLGSDRILTRHNCVPRDLIAVGNAFILGYNVHLGLKTSVDLGDVFAIYAFSERTFQEQPLSLIEDPRFAQDFDDLYKYYKQTRFARFTVQAPFLYMVFRVGRHVTDIKAFKWHLSDETLTYVDNRSDHEVLLPPQHEFQWIRTRRDDHRYGAHPHVSIQDRVFVETIEGDLTIKVEDNTDTGRGIYSEAVENPDQTLDDGEIHYAALENLVLLKIRPFQEKEDRYFIFNEKIQQVLKLDAMRDSCIFLPENQGLIFSNGYYLLSGEYKTFDIDLGEMVFLSRLAAPNGEDYQYVFYNRDTGVNLLLTYNIISRSVETPIICNGFVHFGGGEMVLFRTDDEAKKSHVLQIWQTPFLDTDHPVEAPSDSLLFKIGNKEIVQCMSQCQALINLVGKDESYASLYVDIVKEAQSVLDAFFWTDKDEAFNLKEALEAIRGTATLTVEEFEKVVRIRRATQQQLDAAWDKTQAAIKEITYGEFKEVGDYVETLSRLRILRGEIISLKELRYTDPQRIVTMEEKVRGLSDTMSAKCVEFLLDPAGLDPYKQRVSEQSAAVDEVTGSARGRELGEDIAKTASDLDLLIDIVSNLKIDDPAKSTEIIDTISSVYATLNQVKSRLSGRMSDLRLTEGTAEFNAQIKLLSQATVNYLDVVDSPEKCEEFLTKLMVQLEELEGRFADFDEFLPQLADKREELFEAFESRKLALVEKRNKRAGALMTASERILKGIENNLKRCTTVSEINGYFASNLMVEKVRDIVTQLLDLGDSVKADDLESRIKTVKEEAVRQLKDRQELFVGGADVIRFGTFQFSVNTQPLDLSVVQREGRLFYHLTGTDFWYPLQNEEILKLRHIWDMDSPAESPDVYRGEYLAYKLFEKLGGREPTEALGSVVQSFMAPRLQEGYTKGVHDEDAAKILAALLSMARSLDLVTFSPTVRALASLYWHRTGDDATRARLRTLLKGLSHVSSVFGGHANDDSFTAQVSAALRTFIGECKLFEEHHIPEAARYLSREIKRGESFVISKEAEEIVLGFRETLRAQGGEAAFSTSLKALSKDLEGALLLVEQWLLAWAHEHRPDLSDELLGEFLMEAVALLVLDDYAPSRVVETRTGLAVEGLIGTHSRIEKGTLRIAFSPFMERLTRHDRVTIPEYQRFAELKREFSDRFRSELRLEEFRPRVLTSFVRNQLIDKVYLPLIGANLAKQIGVVGSAKRTDLMGMLLLISPPGYGKTTLMEYIASRLGIIFMKVNGPAIGHQVTSLDPADAGNAAAREELEKLNLAFEMGNNVMIYVDDIQHCNPEFLQKFISLCDGQRKIEGVYKGVSKTYDLRGKKVAVVMAGNPYTESGDKFQIPDMLANRSDVYNLGDMLRENEKAFKLSYLENCLTSNPVLSPLMTKSTRDVYTLIEAAESGIQDALDLEGTYSVEEINEFVNILKKLLMVRNIVLKVNMEYIRSAAMTDEYRVEPPFKLQGSYRNMNKIAEKILPVMNDQELDSLVLGSYENDAQTLTTGAEANMLKWKEIAGMLSETDSARWEEIRQFFLKGKLVRGDDKAGQIVLKLSDLSDTLAGVREILQNAFNPRDPK